MARSQKIIVNPDFIRPGMITKVTDIPNATQKVIDEVAHYYNVPVKTVEEIVTFIGAYTKNVINTGAMETVVLPYFGKFAPNMKLLQAKVRRKRTSHNFSQLLELAMRSKQINFKPQTPTPNVDSLQEEEESEDV